MKILEYKLRKVIEEIQIWTKDWGQVTVRFLPVGGTRQQVRAGSQGRQMRQRWHLESDAWDTGDTIHEGLKKTLLFHSSCLLPRLPVTAPIHFHMITSKYGPSRSLPQLKAFKKDLFIHLAARGSFSCSTWTLVFCCVSCSVVSDSLRPHAL